MKNSIKVERAKKSITQEQLADAMNVSRQTINAIEKNKYLPSTLLSLKMSKYFGVTVNELFELEADDFN
jgi:putative transcriptional regulator